MTSKPLCRRTDLWEEAQAILKRIGFEFVNLSMDGETAYWRWPGETKEIRVSLHGKTKARHANAHLVVASVSFGGPGAGSNSKVPPHMMPISQGAFEKGIIYESAIFLLHRTK